MNRIDRLTAILIQLQGKKIVKASEIADRFNISLRTVYRDVKALQEAGVPIGAEAGTGYYIVDGYHLPPVMFSKEEAAALLTGEKLMEKFSDHSNRKQFSLAMEKIRSVLRGSEKDYLESLDENIAVVRYQALEAPGVEEFPNRFLSDIQHALGMNQVINMEYFSFQDEVATRREVEPIGIFHMSAHWHLIAFCRLRQGYRDFRVDRIRKLNVLAATYKKDKHLSLQDYLEQQRNKNRENTHLIKIAIDNELIRYVRDQKYYFGLMEEKVNGNQTELTFLQSHLGYFARWLIMFGNRVSVIQPEELKTTMKDLVTELHEHYF